MITVRVPGAWVGAAVGMLAALGLALLELYVLPQPDADPGGLWQAWMLHGGTAALAGLLAGRWALRVPRAPGLGVGVLLVAFVVGLGWGMFGNPLALTSIPLALMQVILALLGGMVGTLLARRAAAQPQPQPHFQPGA